MKFLIFLISRIPLEALRSVAALIGRLMYRLAPGYRERIKENLRRAGIYSEALARQVAEQQAIQGVEAPWVWGRGRHKVLELTRGEDKTIDLIDQAIRSGRSIIFLTPHIGCYEVAPMWVAERWLKGADREFAVLYRIPRKSYLRNIVGQGRISENIVPASADLKGVRQIIRIMKHGGITGILPDQVPSNGEGLWVNFFGEPAYTMTFPMRLAKQFNAQVILARALREKGGWCIYCEPLDYQVTGDLLKDTVVMNQKLAETILKSPEQYLWSYNRYKCPQGVIKPTQNEKSS